MRKEPEWRFSIARDHLTNQRFDQPRSAFLQQTNHSTLLNDQLVDPCQLDVEEFANRTLRLDTGTWNPQCRDLLACQMTNCRAIAKDVQPPSVVDPVDRIL